MGGTSPAAFRQSSTHLRGVSSLTPCCSRDGTIVAFVTCYYSAATLTLKNLLQTCEGSMKLRNPDPGGDCGT